MFKHLRHSALYRGLQRVYSYVTHQTVSLGTVIDAGPDAAALLFNPRPDPVEDPETGRIQLGAHIELYPLGTALPCFTAPDNQVCASRYLMIHTPSQRKTLITIQEYSTLLQYWRVLPPAADFPTALFELFFTPGALH